MVAGVSQTAYHLRNLSGRHQQAMKALQMGLLLEGTGPLFHYDAYSIYHCLELCAPQVNLLQLCHSAQTTGPRELLHDKTPMKPSFLKSNNSVIGIKTDMFIFDEMVQSTIFYELFRRPGVQLSLIIQQPYLVGYL